MSIYYKHLLFLVVTVTLGYNLSAQETVSKTIDKTLLVEYNSEFNIENKYGDIIINGWEQNTIQVKMDVKVNNKKEENATDLLNRIEPHITVIGNIVSLKTEILPKKGNSFSRYFNKANPIDSDKGNVEVNYIIYVPKTIAINITNKYGDIIIEDFSEKVTANLQHGDMWVSQNINSLKVDVKFGKLKAKDVLFADFTLKNAKLDLKSSEDLKLNSSGSTIKVEQIGSLEMVSSKDDIKIDTIGEIKGESKFSTIIIDNINNYIDLKLKVTDFNVLKINKLAAIIRLEQESSDIDIDITGLSFNFKAYLREGVLRIPKSFENINSEMIDKSERLREISATYGEQLTGKLLIIGEKGTIFLRDTSLNN